MSARAKPAYDYRTDERLLQVARETGYPVSEVYSRGVKACRDNPRGKAGDFDYDQTIPDFEPVRRVDLENSETPADVLAQTRAPAGFVDMDRDAQLLPSGRAYDGTPLYLLDRNTDVAQVVAGIKSACSMPRVSVRGGIAFSGRLNGVEVFRSSAMSIDEADQREPEFRAALYALAATRG